MRRFKIGDIVTIKTEIKDDGGGPGYDAAMDVYKGGTYKVKAIYSHTYNWYELKSLNEVSADSGVEYWVWSGEWLDPVQARPSITEML